MALRGPFPPSFPPPAGNSCRRRSPVRRQQRRQAAAAIRLPDAIGGDLVRHCGLGHVGALVKVRIRLSVLPEQNDTARRDVAPRVAQGRDLQASSRVATGSRVKPARPRRACRNVAQLRRSKRAAWPVTRRLGAPCAPGRVVTWLMRTMATSCLSARLASVCAICASTRARCPASTTPWRKWNVMESKTTSRTRGLLSRICTLCGNVGQRVKGSPECDASVHDSTATPVEGRCHGCIQNRSKMSHKDAPGGGGPRAPSARRSRGSGSTARDRGSHAP